MVRLCVIAAAADAGLRQSVQTELRQRDVSVEFVRDPLTAERTVLVASRSAVTDQAVGQQLAPVLGARGADQIAIVLAEGHIAWGPGGLETDALPRALAARLHEQPLFVDARSDRVRAVAKLADALVGPRRGRSAPPPAPPPAALAASDLTPPIGELRPAKRRRQWPWVCLLLAVLGVVAILLLRPQGGNGAAPPPPSADGDSSDGTLIAVVALGVAAAAVIVAVLTQVRVRRRAPAGLGPRPVSPFARANGTPPAARSNTAEVVFISHDTTADGELAHRLADDLSPSHDVWIAPDSLRPGDDWLFAIDDNLRSSKAFLLLLSTSALRSPWVRKEIQGALLLEVERDRPRIIPIEVEACDTPVLLRGYHMLSLRQGYPTVLARLQSTLAE